MTPESIQVITGWVRHEFGKDDAQWVKSALVSKYKRLHKPEPHQEYADCIELYDNFIKGITGGVGAKIDGQEGKAMNAILTYLKSQMKEGQEVQQGLRVIFKNWKKLDQFLQKQTKLSQINSNLQNIIIQIKYGRPTAEQQLAASEARIIADYQAGKDVH